MLTPGFQACQDEADDNKDVNGKGVYIYPNLAVGTELEENSVLDIRMELKNGSMAYVLSLLGLNGISCSSTSRRHLKCLGNDGDYPVRYELNISQSEFRMQPFFSLHTDKLVNEPVILTQESFGRWSGQKKGTKIAESEEEEELMYIASEFNLIDQLWPDGRMALHEEWESGNVSIDDLPGVKNIKVALRLKFSDTTSVGGHLCAILDEYTTLSALLATPDSENLLDEHEVEVKIEGQILFDLVDKYVIRETAKGVAKFKIKVFNDKDETIVFNLEGPLTFNYQAQKTPVRLMIDGLIFGR